MIGSPRLPLVFASLATLAGGCATAGLSDDGVFRDGPVAFRPGPLPSTWQRVRGAPGQIAWHHAEGGSIAASGSCSKRDDAPLDVLTNHLLLGLEDRHERSREPLTLDGRAALRTRMDGTLDGVPLALDLVVMKKDGCVYDLQLATPPALHDARAEDFSAFARGFRRVPGTP